LSAFGFLVLGFVLSCLIFTIEMLAGKNDDSTNMSTENIKNEIMKYELKISELLKVKAELEKTNY
jgi:hypothetical protein